MLPDNIQFIEIEATRDKKIGWRHDAALTSEIRSTIGDYIDCADPQFQCFTKPRIVTVPAFKIAAQTFSWESVFEWDEERIESIETLGGFCDQLECDLIQYGLRLPTEDEFEIACGGSLFAWGDEMPSGVPYGDLTDFTKHKILNEKGLLLNSNTYNVEITRTALKLGDGGESVCGGYEWPIPWLSFCPAYRVSKFQLHECLSEFLEDAQVRPVKMDNQAIYQT